MATYVNYNFKEMQANIQSWEEKEQRKLSPYSKQRKKGINTEAEKKKSQSMKKGKPSVMKTNLNKSKFFIKRKRLPDWIKK